MLILEHSIYSVISPEGAASILWRDGARAKDAATAMKITAQDLIRLKIVDRDHRGAGRRRALQPGTPPSAAVGDAVEEELKALMRLSPAQLKKQRAARFYAIGREGLQ